MTAELDGASLVDGNMTCLDGHHSLIALQQGVDDGGVGLRAAYQEENVGIGTTCSLSYLLLSRLAERVLAIAAHLLHVGLCQAAQNLRMCPLRVVACK